MKLIFLLFISLITSCSKKEVKVKALQDVNVYYEVDVAFSEGSFVLSKGSVCTLGSEIYGKVDKFTEIECGDKKGFIFEDEKFERIN
ncbi:MAG: DNA mismatch repair protein MutS [Neisseria meningitidis]|jgi:lipoprotein|nr:DNA mismatch repair protein MutS [Neisseria meningitidis]